MDKATKNSAIAAALVLLGFGVVGFFMPAIVLKLGEISPFFGGAAAVLFVLAFFGIFWLRGRRNRNGDR